MDSNGDIGLGITQSMHGGCLVLGHDYWIKGLTTIRKSYIGFCVSSEFFIDQQIWPWQSPVATYVLLDTDYTCYACSNTWWSGDPDQSQQGRPAIGCGALSRWASKTYFGTFTDFHRFGDSASHFHLCVPSLFISFLFCTFLLFHYPLNPR